MDFSLFSLISRKSAQVLWVDPEGKGGGYNRLRSQNPPSGASQRTELHIHLKTFENSLYIPLKGNPALEVGDPRHHGAPQNARKKRTGCSGMIGSSAADRFLDVGAAGVVFG
jgi:hypothetical protein